MTQEASAAILAPQVLLAMAQPALATDEGMAT
jgi:hypothetical protein